jgi:hypothetical protein
MANFPGLVLTVEGRSLQSKAQIGTSLTFTRVAIGDGESNFPDQMTQLSNEILSLSIQELEVIGDGTSKLRVIMTNESLGSGFFVRELGLYAEDPDTKEEVLYSYTNSGDQPDYLPAGGGSTIVENVFDLYTVVGNAQNVTARISDYITIATKQDIQKISHLLLPRGGLRHQLARKRSNDDGDLEWFYPSDEIDVSVVSVEERRIAVEAQRTFSLSVVSTKGLAVYVNGERVSRSKWTPVTDVQMRFNFDLSAGDEVIFVQNEETGDNSTARISLTGPSTIYPGSVNSYEISDYDSFSEYSVDVSRGDVSVSGSSFTITLDANESHGPLDINITRDGKPVLYFVAVGAPVIAPPSLVFPTNNAVDVGLSLVLQSSEFKTYPKGIDAPVSSSWQLSLDESFSNIIFESVEDSDNVTSLPVPSELLEISTFYYARCRHHGAELGVSEWSQTISFKTDNKYIEKPSITHPVNSGEDIPESPIIESSAFSAFPEGVDVHFATSWRLIDEEGSVLWEKMGDSENKINISIPPGTLQESKEYAVQVMYIGENLKSPWSDKVVFYTASQFAPEDGNAGVPFAGGYFVRRMFDEEGSEYALVVCSEPEQQIFNSFSFYEVTQKVSNLSINGYTDWRVPTIDEMRIMFREFKSSSLQNDTRYGATDKVTPPLGNYTEEAPGVTALPSFLYRGGEQISGIQWTQSETDSYNALVVHMTTGYENVQHKSRDYQVRAVRRSYLQGSQ